MKILLVGASGFIGRHIIAGLQSDNEVICASRRSGIDLNNMLFPGDCCHCSMKSM